jgi:hypothetical protein
LAEFYAPEEALPAFRTLFQQGVGITIQTGATLEDLLCGQWGIERDYVLNRISTLFLDGKPVDDLAACVVEEGATLALSGAMPGLIGATMRRGGVLAPFRSGITYCPTATTCAAGSGRITLKLFNLLIDELGPQFLSRGVWIDRTRLRGHFPDRPELDGAGEIRVVLTASQPSPKRV